MTFPKGEVIHQDLSTAYTDTSELLSTLMSNGFSGVVELVFPRCKGAFFISSGLVVNAVVEDRMGGVMMAGEEATQQLLSFSDQEDGTLTVVRLSQTQVEFAASAFGSEVIHKDLSTDFVKLDRFIRKLADEKHNGFLEIFSREGEPLGTIFFKDGNPAGIYNPSASPSFREPEAVPEFLGQISRQGATFNVHRSIVRFPLKDKTPAGEATVRSPSERPPERQEIVPGPERPMEEEETIIVREEDPPGMEEMAVEPERSTGREEPVAYEDRQPPRPQKDMFQEEKESMERGWVAVNAVNKEMNGRSELIVTLQKILARVEQLVDGFSQKGTFQRTFKGVLIDKSDQYPFIDPFAGQFDYYDGKISLDEEIDTEKFGAGIADCFNLTLSRLKKGFPKNMVLPHGLKTDIESFLKCYPEPEQFGGET